VLGGFAQFAFSQLLDQGNEVETKFPRISALNYIILVKKQPLKEINWQDTDTEVGQECGY